MNIIFLIFLSMIGCYHDNHDNTGRVDRGINETG